jgi:hypothetical protein
MRLVPGAAAVTLALALSSVAGPSVDSDGDTVFDVLDNCRLLANKAPLDCDRDDDGYGNRCDGDFDQNLAVNALDFGKYIPDFKKGIDSGIGSDMDCNGVNAAIDFGLFVPQFKQGKPGPSGLHCAGTVPCDL